MKSNISELMKAKGESYRSLEKEGFSQKTIWTAIKTIDKCRMETLCRLADHLGVCVKDLFDDGCG